MYGLVVVKSAGRVVYLLRLDKITGCHSVHLLNSYMSIPTESTPLLLPSNGNGEQRTHDTRHQPRPRRTEADLQSYPQRVISSLRNDPTGPLPEIIAPDAEITILLYTLIFLSTSSWSAEDDGVVAQVGAERIDGEIKDRIKDEVGKLLDKGGSREVGHVDNANLKRVLWDRWEVEPGIWVSCEYGAESRV